MCLPAAARKEERTRFRSSSSWLSASPRSHLTGHYGPVLTQTLEPSPPRALAAHSGNSDKVSGAPATAARLQSAARCLRYPVPPKRVPSELSVSIFPASCCKSCHRASFLAVTCPIGFATVAPKQRSQQWLKGRDLSFDGPSG